MEYYDLLEALFRFSKCRMHDLVVDFSLPRAGGGGRHFEWIGSKSKNGFRL